MMNTLWAFLGAVAATPIIFFAHKMEERFPSRGFYSVIIPFVLLLVAALIYVLIKGPSS